MQRTDLKGINMAEMGRPKKEINKDLFEALLEIPFSTCEHIAGVFKCSTDTIVRWIKAEYECTFADLKAQRKENMKLKIAGKQYEMAMKGNVAMLIWLGKNELGQTDKNEHKVTDRVTIVIDKDDAKL